MDVIISGIQMTGNVKAEWHLKNWDTDFAELKHYAECELGISTKGNPNPIGVRFSFRDNINDGGNKWLSLNAKIYNFHQPIIISVDVETKVENPADIRGARFTLWKNEDLTIQEKFIQTGRHSSGRGCQRDEITRPNELRFNMTVTVFTFNTKKRLAVRKADMPAKDQQVSEATLTKDVKAPYATEENFSDVKLETKDNMTLSAHRFILAARSPVFRKIIEENVNKDGFNGTIKMSEVNAKPLLVVLYWMYTGELHTNAEKVIEEVMEFCVTFEMKDLLSILNKKLITVCSINNMFQLFQLAKKHGMETAKEEISQFIKENISES